MSDIHDSIDEIGERKRGQATFLKDGTNGHAFFSAIFPSPADIVPSL